MVVPFCLNSSLCSLHQDYLTCSYGNSWLWSLYSVSESGKRCLIHLVCGGAEIVKFHQVLCLALLLGAPALTYPFLFFSFPLLAFSGTSRCNGCALAHSTSALACLKVHFNRVSNLRLLIICQPTNLGLSNR